MTDMYENLESFDDFQSVADPRYYVQVPESWYVLVAYIAGANDAIQQGRYRDVNTIGGACIAGVKNAIKGLTTDFPYVFGGDTTTIALPENCYYEALNSLLALRRMAKQKFNLELTVQGMSVGQIQEESGKTVEVARFEIHQGMSIALFRGGGVGYAETRTKNENLDSLSENGSKRENVDLQGLSCRWDKMPTRQGCIMSLLVYDNPSVEGNVYQEVLEEIDLILNKDIQSNNPANVEMATYKGVGQLLREERRFHESAFSAAFLGRAFEIILCVIIFKFGLLKKMIFDSQSYAKSMRSHADYCKFDDMIRMVLDCSKDQANAIEFMLQDMHDHGQKLYFGIFYSTHSVMTCLVEDVTEGNHIHFMDGDDGGYAMAAKQLKAQMEAEQNGTCAKFALHQPLSSNIIMDEESAGGSFGHQHRLASWNLGHSSDAGLSPLSQPSGFLQTQVKFSAPALSPSATPPFLFSPPVFDVDAKDARLLNSMEQGDFDTSMAPIEVDKQPLSFQIRTSGDEGDESDRDGDQGDLMATLQEGYSERYGSGGDWVVDLEGTMEDTTNNKAMDDTTNDRSMDDTTNNRAMDDTTDNRAMDLTDNTKPNKKSKKKKKKKAKSSHKKEKVAPASLVSPKGHDESCQTTLTADSSGTFGRGFNFSSSQPFTGQSQDPLSPV